MTSETAGGGREPKASPPADMPGGPLSVADLDHGDLGPNILAAAAITWTIALVFVLLRFYTRLRLVRGLGLTDWTLLLSLLAAGGHCVTLVIQVNHGMGKHVWDVDPNNFLVMMQAWWFALLTYVLTLSLTKVSICLLYLTIFTFEWAQRASWVVLFIVVASNLTAFVSTLTYCLPLEAAWNPAVEPWFCHSDEMWWANAALAIVTDFLIFILPMPFLAPLKLPRRQKVIVVGVFAIGFFVCIVSLIRLAILIRVKQTIDPDFTYSPTTLTYWTLIEFHTAIVVACTMTLKPLVAKFFPNLIEPRGSDGNGPAGAGGDSKDDGSGSIGSDPPLTIGSRPSRPLQARDGHDERQLGMEEVMYGDEESGLAQGGVNGNERVRGYSGFDFDFSGGNRNSHAIARNDDRNRRLEVGGNGDGTNGKTGFGPGLMPSTENNITSSSIAPPWPAVGDGASERTDPDLGRVATVRSIG
ncbi:hypothetical protein VTJ49DRAFT_2745 [Mycothermus thermophilus]|uniref:Rhodopsin domain-containing protein n=1 Tax=Humicola insolens TaxID=85995 RepID=A0ABR3VMR1_HUMIN